jgi:hypothetical protein
MGTLDTPVHYRTMKSARFPSFFGEADRCSHRPRGTPNSPVAPSDHWLSHLSSADRAVKHWMGAWLAHRTVWCTPDSLVNFSRSTLSFFRRAACSPSAPAWAPDTVWYTPDSPVHRRLVQVWLSLARLLQFDFSHFEKFPST